MTRARAVKDPQSQGKVWLWGRGASDWDSDIQSEILPIKITLQYILNDCRGLKLIQIIG
jgi:hypothetical protein